MAGIYIHIPFCKRKCHYCNFFSVASDRQREAFLKILLKEAEIQQDYLEGEIVNTIYFGGGTPSLLVEKELLLILDKIYSLHEISKNAEITLEANPDDLDTPKIKMLSGTPINRLSIGVQSFFDADLQYLNRIHNASQSEGSIKTAQDHGFENLTIDLIYGIPTLTDVKWEQNLDRFFSFDLPHLSAYALTVEPKTALHQLIRKEKTRAPDEQASVDQFKTLLEKTKHHDFIHYEISNFSRAGFYSRHNSIYWLGGNYLGLGPSAHSYNGHSRQWNVSSLPKYIQLGDYQNTIMEKEFLSNDQKYNEYVMTSLRTHWGCDLEHIQNVFGKTYCDSFRKSSQKFIHEGKLLKNGNRVFLTEHGKLFADGIASELFI